MPAVLYPEGVRALDAHTIETLGVASAALMELAGVGAARELLSRMPADEGVLVVAGRGNNGGDGYVMARALHLAGIPVRVLGLPGDTSPDCASNRASVEALGIPVLAEPPQVTKGVVVDALLGTGLREELRGEVAERVDWIRGLDLPTLAVDMPTGICGRTGRVLGCAVRADVTVTIGRPKMGAFLHPGAEHVGELVYLDIGLTGPEEAVATITDPAWVRDRLPVRSQNSHKGSHGHLGVVAGSPTKAGAAVLVCNGAIRSGCGLVTLLIHPGAMERLSALREEIMVQPCEGFTPGDVASFDALAIGPGFGTDAVSQEILRRLWYEAEAPAVFDADGLTALAGEFQPSSHPRCITPHPGEAGRLLGRTSAEINADRLEALSSLSAVAPSLLKGNQSLVTGQPPRINRSGGPQLSTAGSGDVLTGVVGAMLAQGMDPVEALAVGAFVHGRAGERAGTSPIVAGDVVECLGEAIRDPEKGRSVLETRYLLGRKSPTQEVLS